MYACNPINICILRENAAASLVVMQGNNDKLRAAYFNDLKEGKLSESKENYPPYQNSSLKSNGNFYSIQNVVILYYFR
jgi:hypothetical protein